MRTDQLLESLSNCLTIDTASGSLYIYGNLQQEAVKSAVLYADANGKIIAAPDGAGGGGGLTAVGVNDLTAVGIRSNETFLRGDNTFSSITDFNVTDALGYTPLASINSSMVTTALGYTPYNGGTNPNGYITQSFTDGRYLQLTGGTLSGGLAGTSASFSSTLGVTGALTGSSTASFTSSVTASAFFESSDKNLKVVLKNNYIPYGIENIESRLYIKNNKEELGYFAQDVESILPSAVTVNANGFLSLSYREVHTAKIAYLEKEVKELKAQLARL